MARVNGESRIPVLRSSGSSPALSRPTMLVAPRGCAYVSTDTPEVTSGPSSPVSGGLSADDLGRRVIVGGEATGVLRFFGNTHLEPIGSLWCGIELDTAHGRNDGCVHGIRYFRCRPKYGILAPVHKVRLLEVPSPSRPKKTSNKTSPSNSTAIKRRVTSDRSCSSRDDPNSPRNSGCRNKTESSGSSQDEITPPVEEQSQVSRPQVQRKPRSASATPTPGSTSPWQTWSGNESPVDEDDVGPASEANELDVVQGGSGLSPQESQRRRAGSLVLPLAPHSPLDGHSSSLQHQLIASSSKQSSFELDDSLGILTPDQMVTDFTVTSAGLVSEDDERPGSGEFGGLMQDDVAPPISPLAEDTMIVPRSPTPPLVRDAECIPPGTEGVMSVSDDVSLTNDSTSKDAACTWSQQQSTSSSSAQQSACSSSTACSSSAVTTSGTSLAPAWNFINSVTSITSLETGYQGDGEWSRPTSRADNSPGVPNPPPPGVLAVDVHKLKFDVMTDSDFFSDTGAPGTESDVEHEAAGMTVGDRRARVIDGTLYGTSPANSVAGVLPAAPAHMMTSSTATIEEMDSSGIYSDMERRPDNFEPSTLVICKPAEDECSTVAPAPSCETLEQDANSIEENVPKSPQSVIKVEPPTNNKEEKVVKKQKMPKRNVASKIKALIESGPAVKPDENQENRRHPRKGGKWDAVMNKIAQNQAEEKTRPKLKEVKSRVLSSITAPPSPQSPKTVSRTSAGSTRTNCSRPNSAARTRRENAAATKPKPRRNRLRGAESSASLQRVAADDAEERLSLDSSHRSSISDLSRDPCKPSPPRSTKKRAAVLDGVATAHLNRSGSPLSDVSTNSAPIQTSVSRTPTNNNNNALLHTPRPASSPAERGPKILNGGVTSVQQRNQRNSLLSNNASPPSRRVGVTPGSAQKAPQDKSNTAVVVPTSTIPTTQTPAAEMKTPISVRKQQLQQQAPRISQKSTPLRDHNRLSGTRQPLHDTSVPVGKTDVPVIGNNNESKNIVATPLPPHLVQELKHAAAGCEAMAVVVQYLVHSMDAFSTPRLKNELATMREEWVRTKLELEEAHASYRRLQGTLSDEVAAHERREEARRVEHEEAMAALVKQHEAALEAAHTERQTIEQRLQEQLEVKTVEGAAREATLAEMLAELAEARAQVVRRHEESACREAELGEQLARVSAELAEAKANSKKFWNSVNKDRDSKLQLSIDQCQTLQKEVESLQAVLELKSAEIQSLRKTCATAQESAERVPSLEIALSAARSKIEDLQSQLNSKISIERQLKEENKMLNESYMMEAQQNRRLSNANEELQWKLKQSFEAVNRLASANSPIPITSSTMSPMSPLFSKRTSNGSSFFNNNNSHRLSPGLDDELPDTPRVKVVAEKTDSIAWVLDMTETVDAMVERAHSNQRQRNQEHRSPARCLPKKSASTSAILSEQRCKQTSRKSRVPRGMVTSTPNPMPRCRSRSVSTDSESLELEPKSCTSQPEQVDNGISDNAKVDGLTMSGQTSSSTQPSSPSTLLTLPFKIQLQPQEGAGEAMISEEISDDAHSDCDANPAADLCSGRSSESSSLLLANGAQLDMDDDEDDDEEEEEKDQKHLPIANKSHVFCEATIHSTTIESVSHLGPTDSTAMDLSWSEDFDLFPSECEG